MEDNILGERIRAIRGSASLREFAKRCDISHTHLDSIEKGCDPRTGKRVSVTWNTLKKLSAGTGCSVQYLVGDTSICDEGIIFTAEGKRLENVSPLKTLKEKSLSRAFKPAHLKRLPVLGTIRAGEPLFAEQHIVGYEYANADETKNGEYFYLKVTGDSMIGSRIQDGDLVLVKKQDYVDENGQIAVVLVNAEEATLKRVYLQKDQVMLQADNPKYAPMVLREAEIRIIGRVMEVKFKP